MGFQSSSQSSSSQPESVPELGIEHFVAQSERFRPRDVEKLVEEWGFGEDALSKYDQISSALVLHSRWFYSNFLRTPKYGTNMLPGCPWPINPLD